MSDSARRSPSVPDLTVPRDDESSIVRSREQRAEDATTWSVRQVQQRPSAASTERGRTSGMRPATKGSLDERIEQKLRVASALARDLPGSDARVRLLNIAVMRRDEALLDGVLAELNKPAFRR
jgi:hypothetical protein